MKTPIPALACLAMLLAQPLFAADPSAAPGKSAAIILEDGRTATVSKGKLLLVDQSGKITPAPAGNYTAKDGVVWTVDASGQAHAQRAVPQKPVQSGSQGQSGPVVSGTFVPFPTATPPKSPQAGAAIRSGSSTPVPTPPKLANPVSHGGSKVALDDGRTATITNGKFMLVDESGKATTAPAGNYTAKNGVVWAVDANGQAHAQRAVPQKPAQTGSPGQQPVPVVSGSTSFPFPTATPPKSPKAGPAVRSGSSTPTPVPPTPPKLANPGNSKFLLEDGSLAVIGNGKLFVQGADQKFSPAPAGSYTAKNGTVYNVTAGGQVAVNRPEGLPAVQDGNAPAAAPRTTGNEAEARELANVPAALKGLKIFRSGKANRELMGLKKKIVSARLNSLAGLAGQTNVNTDNAPPTQPDQGTAPTQQEEGETVITPSNIYPNPNWLMLFGRSSIVYGGKGNASSPFFFGLLFEDSNIRATSWIGICHLLPKAGKYYMIDLSFSNMKPTSQVNVSGPDGSVQTFTHLTTDSADKSHARFGYVEDSNTPGLLNSFEIAVDGDLWIFYSATITPVPQ